MSTQFNRKYTLQIGTPAGTTTTSGGKTTATPGAGEGFEITDLQVTFSITKTADPSADVANIKVFNLSQSSRSKLTKDSVVLLKVGYEGQGLSTIFTGSISAYSTTLEGANLITTLDCADGYTPFKNTTLNKNFEKGVSVEKVIKYCASQAGIPIGALLNTGLSSGQGLYHTYSRGYVAEKALRDQLVELTKPNGLEFNVQSGYLIVKPIDTDNLEPVVAIDRGNGLVGSPSNASQSKKKTGGKVPDLKKAATVAADTLVDAVTGVEPSVAVEDKDAGIAFETLMNPLLVVGRRVLLNSDQYKDVDIRLSKVVHSGQFRGSKWNTKAEGKII